MADLLRAHRPRMPLQAEDSVDLPRLAFVHIPKTAGTSVTTALDAAFGPLTLPAMTTLDYQHYNDDRLQAYRFYKGHAYRRDYARLPADTIRFTVLRDPVRRAMSYFTYCRGLEMSADKDDFVNEAIAMAKTASVIEFIHADCATIIEHLRLGQMRQFLPPETLAVIGHRQVLTRAMRQRVVREFIVEMERFHYVMTCEALALSFPLMATRLGLPPACRSLAHENTSQRSAEPDWADIRRSLVDVNAAEFECYDYVREREQAWLAAELAHACGGPTRTKALAAHA